MSTPSCEATVDVATTLPLTVVRSQGAEDDFQAGTLRQSPSWGGGVAAAPEANPAVWDYLAQLIEVPKFANGSLVPPQDWSTLRKYAGLQFGYWIISDAK